MGASHRHFQPAACAQSATARVMAGVACAAVTLVKAKPVSDRYARKEAARRSDSYAVGSSLIR